MFPHSSQEKMPWICFPRNIGGALHQTTSLERVHWKRKTSLGWEVLKKVKEEINILHDRWVAKLINMSVAEYQLVSLVHTADEKGISPSLYVAKKNSHRRK